MATLESQRAQLTEIVNEYIGAHPELISAEQGDEDFSFEDMEAVFEELSAEAQELVEELASQGAEGILEDMKEVISEPQGAAEAAGAAAGDGPGEITQSEFEQAAEAAIESGDPSDLQAMAETTGGELTLELTAATD